MRRLAPALLLLAVATAGQTVSSDYQCILHPQMAQRAVLEKAQLTWDALHFTFAQGTLALAAPLPLPAPGRAFEAVFAGAGELDVAPPNPIERQQVHLLTGQDTIAVRFRQAIFRFADAAAFRQALGSAAHFVPITGTSPLTALAEDRARAIEQAGWAAAVRTLRALDDPAASGRFFQAALKTDRGWIEADFDPLNTEPVRVWRYTTRAAFGEAEFTDTWTQFADAAHVATPAWNLVPVGAPVHLDDYNLNLEIPGNLDTSVAGTLSVSAREPVRGLLLNFDPNLRVTAAATAAGQPVEFLQPPDPGRNPNPQYRGDWLYLRLPQTLDAGAKVTLKLAYHGKYVIQRVGNGNFFARSAGWYPMNRFGPPFQRANFQLRFQVNRRYTVVATGDRTSNQREGDFQVTTWKSPVPLTVAGFALGDYSEISQPVTLAGGQKVTVNVLTNNSPDDAMSAINTMNSLSTGPGDAPLPIGTLDPKALAPVALRQVGAALEFMSEYYGPYPYDSLSVVPIPGSYGQGWPSLLYLSSLSFLDSTQLHALGAPESALNQLSDTFRAHETSHQWWGHRVSWATPHDQWISEGFANASALLFQQATAGMKASQETLAGWRRDLEAKGRLGHVQDSIGPLWLGNRLISSEDPEGYSTITYDKGGYVLYMLRGMMSNGRSKSPDGDFIAMMKDFTSTYANRDASTADFQAIVEKHMLPVMDVARNHKMDWFFQEYVYGTGIAKLDFHAAVVPDGAHCKVQVTIDNPEHWVGPLPIYIWSGNKFLRGQVAVRQAHESFPIELGFQPSKVVANQYLDMLVDVRQ